MDIRNVKVGDKFPTKSKLIKAIGLTPAKGKNPIIAQDKEIARYLSYEKTGKMSKGKMTNEIVITQIFDTPKEKVDNRKNNGGSNKGKTKYGDVVIPTIIYLLKQSPDNEIITYSTRLLEMIGAISPEYDKIVFNDNYINNRRYSFKQDLKKSFIDSPCNSAANSNYIEYDNEYIMYKYDDFGKWYNATEQEVKIFNDYRKETLKEMDCNNFTDLNKKSFNNQYIKATYNRLLKDKIYNDPLLGWIDYRWYTRIKLIDYGVTGGDNRKQVNDRALTFFDNRIQRMIENNEDYRKGINANKRLYNIDIEKQVGIGIENTLLH